MWLNGEYKLSEISLLAKSMVSPVENQECSPRQGWNSMWREWVPEESFVLDMKTSITFPKRNISWKRIPESCVSSRKGTTTKSCPCWQYSQLRTARGEDRVETSLRGRHRVKAVNINSIYQWYLYFQEIAPVVEFLPAWILYWPVHVPRGNFTSKSLSGVDKE